MFKTYTPKYSGKKKKNQNCKYLVLTRVLTGLRIIIQAFRIIWNLKITNSTTTPQCRHLCPRANQSSHTETLKTADEL